MKFACQNKRDLFRPILPSFHIYLDSYIAIYKSKFEYELYVRSIQYCVISKLIDGHY